MNPDPRPTLEYSNIAREGARPARAMGFALLACAAAPAVALYGTWLAAWLSLGHRPEPSLDDPKAISRAVSVLHVITTLLILAFPLVAMVCLALVPAVLRSARGPASEGQPSSDRLTVGLATGTLAVCFGSFLLFVLDPGGVLYWFMD